MEVIETVAEMKKWRRQSTGTVGFVPTMGYLHEGHLTLARWSRRECDNTVASIFVNPTQFLPGEDFVAYPRDRERDLRMLAGVETDVVFFPPVEEMYPKNYNTYVNVERITDRLEGAFRPGHFKGVATVVAKLFNMVEPDRAYFGQKDAQQCVVVKRMVADLNMNLDIVIVPTVREPDGLAMSSRNVYLSPQQRQSAVVLSKSLKVAEDLWRRGERSADVIKREMTRLIETQPLGKIDYISVADPETLEELSKIGMEALVSLVVRFGKTRLLDNTTLK